MRYPRALGFLHGLILIAFCFNLVIRQLIPCTYHQPTAAESAFAVRQSYRGHDRVDDGNVLDETVHLLLPPDQANAYIGRFPGKHFRFFVYNLPSPFNWQAVSSCIENQVWKNVSNCDWGSSVCTETRSSSPIWSRRRFNRNGDVVIAKLLDEYNGDMRTYDPTQADLFVVPYPSTSNCECRKHTVRCPVAISSAEIHDLVTNLSHWTPETAYRHLFLTSVDHTEMHPYLRNTENTPLVTTIGPARGCIANVSQACGQLVIPYVNTNPEYQPHVLMHKPFTERKYALSAFMSTKIAGNSRDRAAFVQAAANLTVLAGRPVVVTALGRRRTLLGEQFVQEVYRDSIFCPCLRGDEPPQKRFIDAILAGCIPVVLSHPSRTVGVPSHFAPNTDGIHLVYPVAKGIFHDYPDMGIAYEDLVVSVNGSCGIDCLIPTLQDLLEHHEDVLLQKQRCIARLAPLLSFGLGRRALQSPDALAAMLVQARHYIFNRPM